MIYILLTSAIKIPKNGRVINDTEYRAAETMVALEKWNKVQGCNIYLIDNTGYNLADLQERFDRIKMSTLVDGPYQIPSQGEFHTIKAFFDQNQEIAEKDIIIKINARYFVRNVSQLLEDISLNTAIDVWCTLRDNLRFADTRVIAGQKNFWESFIKNGDSFFNTPQNYLEHGVARHIHKRMHEGFIWQNFRHSPVLEGKSGSTGKQYGWLRQNVIKPIFIKLYNWLLR